MHDDLFTIGHSTHRMECFIERLKRHAIDAVCDVRSQPYSNHTPQFNKGSLGGALRENEIAYVFLGKELGARSENSACYVEGKVQYDRLAAELLFKQGIERLRRGMKTHTVALMCAEKDPITCHRMILVCRAMRPVAKSIRHILADGEIETNAEAEERLLAMLKIIPDMLRDKNACIAEAYRKQGQKIAYVMKEKQVAGG